MIELVPVGLQLFFPPKSEMVSDSTSQGLIPIMGNNLGADRRENNITSLEFS